MTKKTPVAFYAYNRPDHARRALDALSKCRQKEDCVFYFFSDGPRTAEALLGVEATRRVLHEQAKVFNAHVVERPSNLGLAKSIVTGVSDLCKEYGRVIVVEDDLVVSPDFLHFMLQSLDHYKNDERVMQVGGCTLASPKDLMRDAFLLPVTTTWGWATWQRAWQHFSFEPKDFALAKLDKSWCKRFDLNGAYAFSAMLEDRLVGRNDSWGVLWWYAVSREQGLVVYPRQSMVWNGGFDGSGVHCGSKAFRQSPISDDAHIPYALTFPPVEYFEPKHLLELENFFRIQIMGSQFRAGFKAKIKKIIRKIRHAIF